jgi:ketosteroid isomerase-like protein
MNDTPESRPRAEPPLDPSAAPYPVLHWEVYGLFSSIDAMDVAAVVEKFTDDGVLRFGNQERVVGKAGVQQAVEALFSRITGLSHSVTGVWMGNWEEGEVVSVESEVTYTLLDGVRLEPLPATTTLRMKQGLIKEFRVFIDPSPLFATET